MAVVTVSQKGWVVIPARLREKYGWQSGGQVQVVDYGGVVSFTPVLANPEDEGYGALKRRGSLLKRLNQARKDERRRERQSK